MLTYEETKIRPLTFDDIDNIQNETVRNEIKGVINEGLSGTQTNIEVSSDIFQYSWVIFILVAGLIIFLFARQVSEYQQGGFVG